MGALSAEKIWVCSLLRWYVDHGAVVKAVYQAIDYQSRKIFTWFVEQMTEASRTGLGKKIKTLLANVFELLGNSSYGKLIEVLEQQTNIICTKDDSQIPNKFIGITYELESWKPWIQISRPFRVGIAVCQLAKLWMLEFYYDFLDRHFNRRDFELIQMDTNSNYMAVSGQLEDIKRPELRSKFEAKRKEWLAWDKWRRRTSGLFKFACEDSRMIVLCSKCYSIE